MMSRSSLISILTFLTLSNAFTSLNHDIPLHSSRHSRRSLKAVEANSTSSVQRRAPAAFPAGWTTAGDCVTDVPGSRLLATKLFANSHTDVDTCLSIANSQGYTYAGVQYGNECWVGNALNTAGGAGGTATNCNMGCEADNSQMCGGYNAMNLYSKTSSSTSSWDATPTCYQDSQSARVLANRIDSGNQHNVMTWETCLALCDAGSYAYCGVQYSGECWADNTIHSGVETGVGLPITGSGSCEMDCSGNSAQKCGGNNQVGIFTKTGSGGGGPGGPPGWPTGWETESSACITDYVHTRRALEHSVDQADDMTNLKCVQTCDALGYEYAGTENSKECYCGHYINRLNGGEVKDSNQCNSACAGDANEICGGWSLISVFKKHMAPQTWVNRLPPHWTNSSSCVVDSSNPRALDGAGMSVGNLDLESCIAFCDIMGYSKAGAEWGKECWCGDDYNTGNNNGQTTTGCDMHCTGNTDQICGGLGAMTVYTKAVPALNLPSGWVQKFCSVDSSSTTSSTILETKVTVSSMTPAACISACPSGSIWAGIKNGNECYCGTYTGYTEPKIPTECSTTCPGNSDLICGGPSRTSLFYKNPAAVPSADQWSLSIVGNSGVVMTGISVMNSETVIVFDRKENNPLPDSTGHPAWASIWNIDGHNTRGLDLITHSFCSAGAWLSNGTFVNFGGQGYEDRNGASVQIGYQGVRFFNPCPAAGTCKIQEYPSRIRLGALRWYPTTTRLHDGSVFVLGGATYAAGWTNNNGAASNSYEFWPSKSVGNGLPVYSQFLWDAMPHNTYPHLFHLPNHDLFIAANNIAMTLNWQTGVETRLPNLPNGQRMTYPYSGAAVMLPLTPGNNYTPEMMICGGSHNSNSIGQDELSAQTSPTSTQCARIVLSSAGIAAGWKTESMPDQRVMLDGVLLPNGKVVIVNGAKTGTASYGNLQWGNGPSNADHPAFTPLLYDPKAPANFRFSYAGMPASTVPRLYHSTAILLPSGEILLGGSNPNDDFSTAKYPSELRVEYLKPSYMNGDRPTFTGLPAMIDYNEGFTLTCSFPTGTSSSDVKVVLMDLGWSTHNNHMDQKLVELVCSVSGNSVTCQGPPNAGVYSPGPGFIWVLAGDVPSVAQKTLIGDGANPPFDEAAYENMLAHT